MKTRDIDLKISWTLLPSENRSQIFPNPLPYEKSTFFSSQNEYLRKYFPSTSFDNIDKTRA